MNARQNEKSRGVDQQKQPLPLPPCCLKRTPQNSGAGWSLALLMTGLK